MTTDQLLDLAAIQARADHLTYLDGGGTEPPRIDDMAAMIAEAQQVIEVDVPALIAEVQRARQREAEFTATLEADGFVAVTQAEAEEYERLKAGEWRTQQGWIVDGEFQTWLSYVTHRACAPTHERRIWTGPVEPVDAQSDSAATDPPHPQPDTETDPGRAQRAAGAVKRATGRDGGDTVNKITE